MDQNGLVRPVPAKIVSISATVFGVQSRRSRPGYHRLANSQHWPNEMVSPPWIPVSSAHRSACPSDRKRRIVLHVNPTSSQNRRGSTPKWTRSPLDRARPPSTRISSGSPQSGQRVLVCASTPRRAGMPRASHAQFAQ